VDKASGLAPRRVAIEDGVRVPCWLRGLQYDFGKSSGGFGPKICTGFVNTLPNLHEVLTMRLNRAKFSAIVLAFAILLSVPFQLRAQGLQNLAPSAAQGLTSTLTPDQQSLANKALCSALASQTSNPASASPSLLSSPSVMGAAASSFAGSTSLPLPSATDLLKGYVAQHATDILASCAVSNATGGLTNKIPGASSLPSMP
jgi:hypothetical protein